MKPNFSGEHANFFKESKLVQEILSFVNKDFPHNKKNNLTAEQANAVAYYTHVAYLLSLESIIKHNLYSHSGFNRLTSLVNEHNSEEVIEGVKKAQKAYHKEHNDKTALTMTIAENNLYLSMADRNDDRNVFEELKEEFEQYAHNLLIKY